MQLSFLWRWQREGPRKATFALAPCGCMGVDLGTEAGVEGACRVGAETPFFSGCEFVLTCKVNITAALIGGSVTYSTIQKWLHVIFFLHYTSPFSFFNLPAI